MDVQQAGFKEKGAAEVLLLRCIFFSEGQTGAKSGWLALWTGLAVLVGFVGNSVRSKISDGNPLSKACCAQIVIGLVYRLGAPERTV